MTAFAALRSFARKPEPVEQCDMCGVALPHRHKHLIDPASRRLVCACTACSLLFPQNGAVKYKSVPDNPRFLADFQLTDGQWESLLIPIGLAFFYRSSRDQRVLAFYPSPAGPTESLLALDAWGDIAAENPPLAAMEPDVEALLVNRLISPAEHYLAPIDKCYELAGLIRTSWRGLSGGAEMWEKIGLFFSRLKEDAGA
jgi:Family of unknown function (DUF5947)